MNTYVIRSYSKINLSLRIIGKKPSTRFHKIQSIITFANLFDFIKIKEIMMKLNFLVNLNMELVRETTLLQKP